mmetsp:Transcript_7376/g.16226  ORF Transcript_7376/g.16226 Transcript_7376/m.16226 type:complete len:425 (+) Transcript_7376:150-1424(+)
MGNCLSGTPPVEAPSAAKPAEVAATGAAPAGRDVPADAGKSSTPPADAGDSAGGGVRQITMAEVAARGKNADPKWLIISGRVFEVGPWFLSHPGGPDAIASNNNQDVTEGFIAMHDVDAFAKLEEFCIGEIVDESRSAKAAVSQEPASGAAPEGGVTAGGDPIALKGMSDALLCPLIMREEVNRDVRLLRFGLPSDTHVLGLNNGQHVRVRATIDGALVARSYTPTSMVNVKGTFDLVIKVYYKNEHADFPAGGIMTQHLDSLKVGDTLQVLGPKGVFNYTGRGEYEVDSAKSKASNFGFICGGSGITPAFQVIQAMLADPEDTSNISLIFAGRAEGDLILRSTIDAWAATHPARFRRFYVISNEVPPEWEYGTGRVTKDMFTMLLPAPASDTLITMCGPPGMVASSRTMLVEMGHADDHVFSF